MKELQKDQSRLTTLVKEKMEIRSRLEKAKDTGVIDVKRIDQKVEKLQTEITSAERIMQKLISENGWVRTERDLF